MKSYRYDVVMLLLAILGFAYVMLRPFDVTIGTALLFVFIPYAVDLLSKVSTKNMRVVISVFIVVYIVLLIIHCAASFGFLNVYDWFKYMTVLHIILGAIAVVNGVKSNR